MKSDMQDIAKTMELPFGVEATSLITKMTTGAGFSQLKAVDWMVWTLAISPFVLRNILKPAYLRHWMLFVRAVRLIAVPAIKHRDIETSDYIPSTLSLDLYEFIVHSDITDALNNPNWQYSCGNEPLPPLTIDSINLSKQITMDTEQFLCLKSFYAHRSSHFKFNVDTMSHNIRLFYQISIFGDTFGSVSGGS
jgi:hypothetical protein